MTRNVIEIGLIVLTLVCGLEVIHYRDAVLEANADRKRAWHLVVDLRAENEKCAKAGFSSAPSGDGSR